MRYQISYRLTSAYVRTMELDWGVCQGFRW